MKKIPLEEIHPGNTVAIEKDGKLYEALVTSTTQGHLGVREVRINTGEVLDYDETNIYAITPELRTESLLSGEKIGIKEKYKPE